MPDGFRQRREIEFRHLKFMVQPAEFPNPQDAFAGEIVQHLSVHNRFSVFDSVIHPWHRDNITAGSRKFNINQTIVMKLIEFVFRFF